MSSGTFYVFRHLHRIDDDSAQFNPMVRQWNDTPMLRNTYRYNPYLGNLPTQIVDDLQNHTEYKGTIKRIVVSPFLRCMQTALYLANLFDIDTITVDYRLSEFGQAIDPARIDGTLLLAQIFDQSMEYINRLARPMTSPATPSDHHHILSDDDLRIFRSILYDDRGMERIKIVLDDQMIESINLNESRVEYSTRLRDVIEALQSDGTLFVTHSSGMLWREPNRWMRYNTMYFYPMTDLTLQVGSSLIYHSNKQKYMAISI